MTGPEPGLDPFDEEYEREKADYDSHLYDIDDQEEGDE